MNLLFKLFYLEDVYGRTCVCQVDIWVFRLKTWDHYSDVQGKTLCDCCMDNLTQKKRYTDILDKILVHLYFCEWSIVFRAKNKTRNLYITGVLI